MCSSRGLKHNRVLLCACARDSLENKGCCLLVIPVRVGRSQKRGNTVWKGGMLASLFQGSHMEPLQCLILVYMKGSWAHLAQSTYQQAIPSYIWEEFRALNNSCSDALCCLPADCASETRNILHPGCTPPPHQSQHCRPCLGRAGKADWALTGTQADV